MVREGKVAHDAVLALQTASIATLRLRHCLQQKHGMSLSAEQFLTQLSGK
jgi:hypothetical protein